RYRRFESTMRDMAAARRLQAGHLERAAAVRLRRARRLRELGDRAVLDQPRRRVRTLAVALARRPFRGARFLLLHSVLLAARVAPYSARNHSSIEASIHNRATSAAPTG